MAYLAIYIFIILLGVGALFFIFKLKKKDAADEKNKEKGETANDFMNVRNIRQQYLFTRDGYVYAYIKVDPINIDLMSDQDMQKTTQALTAELSNIRFPFKFIAVSKQEDISLKIAHFSRIINSTDNMIRRDILRQEIFQRQNQVQNAEVPTRNYYFMLCKENEDETDEDFAKRVKDFKTKLTNCNIGAKIINQKEIIELIELTSNPQYAVAEDINPELNLMFIMNKLGVEENAV